MSSHSDPGSQPPTPMAAAGAREAASGNRLLLWAVGAAIGIVLSTFLGMQLVTPESVPLGVGPMYPRMRMPPTSNTGDLLRAIGVGSFTWYACIVLAPLFLYVSRKFPLDRKRWLTSAIILIVCTEVSVAITALVQYVVVYNHAPSAPSPGLYVQSALLTGSLPFFAVAAAMQALTAVRRAQDREIDSVRVTGQLAEARLAALTAQLQPHFLFNTLQAISALINTDAAAANKMLASLSDLLREVLRRGERREVTLDEELRVLEPYLEISRTRFGERLTVAISVAPDTRNALVPFFILQPLVENALHHGVGSRSGAGTVRIDAVRANDQLRISVSDDGSEVQSTEKRTGIGLPNTRARLEEMYGTQHSLEFGRLPEGGFRVQVGIPFKALRPQ